MIHANGQWKSKKALKEAATPKPCSVSVEGSALCTEHKRPISAETNTCRLGRGVSVDSFTNPSIFGGDVPTDGSFPVVGPSAYIRKWYATVKTQNGRVISVK